MRTTFVLQGSQSIVGYLDGTLQLPASAVETLAATNNHAAIIADHLSQILTPPMSCQECSIFILPYHLLHLAPIS